MDGKAAQVPWGGWFATRVGYVPVDSGHRPPQRRAIGVPAVAALACRTHAVFLGMFIFVMKVGSLVGNSSPVFYVIYIAKYREEHDVSAIQAAGEAGSQSCRQVTTGDEGALAVAGEAAALCRGVLLHQRSGES